MDKRNILPISTVLESDVTNRAHERFSEYQPQNLHKHIPHPRKPLKIAAFIHTPRDSRTAVYKNTCQRVQYLENRGHECHVITPQDSWLLRKLSARLVPLLYPMLIACWLIRHPETNVALFHSYAGWAVTFSQKYFGFFRTLHKAIIFHGLEPLYYSRLKRQAEATGHPLSWRYRLIHGGLMLRFLRQSTKSADTVMCLNAEEARYLVEHDWALRERITVLANHAPEGFFIQRNYRNRATQLLFVGQWLPMKGTQILVTAFTRLCRSHPDLRLCCAGTIESSKHVLENFPEDVRQAISVYPSVSEDELLDLHRAADIFVLPTFSEGFSLALTEAMSSALPIITTPVGAAPDILTDKCSALFIPAMDVNALVTAVTTLLDDPSLRSELGQNVQAAAQGLLPEPTMQDFAFCLESLAQDSGHNVVQSPDTAARGAWWN